MESNRVERSPSQNATTKIDHLDQAHLPQSLSTENLQSNDVYNSDSKPTGFIRLNAMH